jgi:hypothetical protein
MQTRAVFHSAQAAGLYTRLVRHFGHKIPVVESPEGAELQFVCGLAQLRHDADRLSIHVTSGTAAELAQTCEVVESHLLRFAFREEPAPLEWHRG